MGAVKPAASGLAAELGSALSRPQKPSPNGWARISERPLRLQPSLSVHRWFMTPMQRPSLPQVARYCERLGERAGFQKYAPNDIP
jgi:hypothetical protein